MMGKRLDLSSLADTGTKESIAPPRRAAGRLVLAKLERVAPNHVNPRTNFGDPEDLAALGRSIGRKQLQAIRCVTKGAYERLFPEYAEELGPQVDIVVVNGERRYRAALTAGIEGIEAVIDDDLAESRRVFLDAVITENVDRQNFDPIEEATGIDLLVAEFGSADAVAAHYGRHKSWVSQRRSLLRLAPDVQDLVRTGKIPLRRARELSTLPQANQLAAWEQSAAPTGETRKDTPDAQPTPTKSPTKQKIRPESQQADLPWDSPSDLADVLVEKMSQPDLEVLVRFLTAEISTKSGLPR